ncbi:MAG: YceD family protein [Zoogloeaceae bacterium]|nr:YceD family protein [Zoogloeaceae bacterium]
MIDARRFCRESRRLEGVLGLRAFPRLDDLLAHREGEVAFVLEGIPGENGEARLRLEVRGVLSLVCQRCLEAVEETLVIERLLELVEEIDSSITPEELEDERLDFLPLTGALDLAELIEEEILLALPVAPRHAACAAPRPAGVVSGAHPFSVLSSLKAR